MDHNSDKERKLKHHQFLETIKDPKTALVKVADRIHNLRTLEYLKPEKQNRISLETVKMYTPLAYEMGIGEISNYLEEISKKYLPKDKYKYAKNISRIYDKRS